MSAKIPEITPVRRSFRSFCKMFARILTRILIRYSVSGQEHIPQDGPYVVAGNHLWYLDPPLVMLELPTPPEVLGTSKILGWPLVGPVVKAYGMIPVPLEGGKRSALNTGVAVLQHDRSLVIFPEGRLSLSQQLEKGRSGIAYLTHLSGAYTVVPVALTGTEHAVSSWKRLRRPTITLTFGPPIELPPLPEGDAQQDAAQQSLQMVMVEIARMLPEDYRGVYADAV